MHYREVQVEDDKSVADAGTLTVDLNIKDPITALIVRFKVRNDTAVVENQPPERNITKVEIVDGGQVYHSLSGSMSVAAAVYGLGRWPHHWYDNRASNNQRINFPILFGRYIGDPDFAFDPTKLVNPQLKITWADQALYDDGYHAIGITARVMEGVPSPSKCLFWKEVEAWSAAATGVKVVDLPTDYPYRSLMMRGWGLDALPSNVFTHFKLDCDLGKLIVFDLASHEFRDILKQSDGPFHHRQFAYGDTGTYLHAWMGETLDVSGSPDAVGMIQSYTAFGIRFVMSVTDPAGVAIANATAQLLVSGLFPHSSYLYRFGRKNDPETWFRSGQYGDIDLKLTEGSLAADAAVAIQQPRSLP